VFQLRPSGAKRGFRQVDRGGVLTLMMRMARHATHYWITVAVRAYHLKKLLLRIYWDPRTTPSVEAPLGDFSARLGNIIGGIRASSVGTTALTPFSSCHFKSMRASPFPTKASKKWMPLF